MAGPWSSPSFIHNPQLTFIRGEGSGDVRQSSSHGSLAPFFNPYDRNVNLPLDRLQSTQSPPPPYAYDHHEQLEAPLSAHSSSSVYSTLSAYSDDPAFSADPLDNPNFVMTNDERFVPVMQSPLLLPPVIRMEESPQSKPSPPLRHTSSFSS